MGDWASEHTKLIESRRDMEVQRKKQQIEAGRAELAKFYKAKEVFMAEMKESLDEITENKDGAETSRLEECSWTTIERIFNEVIGPNPTESQKNMARLLKMKISTSS